MELDTGIFECVSVEAGGAARLGEDSGAEVVWLIVEVVGTEWPVVVAIEVVDEAVVVFAVEVGGPVCTGRESTDCHRIETPNA